MINATSPPAGSSAPLILDATCDLRGTLRVTGDLRLLGSFDGALEVCGLVTVGPDASLRGRATVGGLRVEGVVDATVNAAGAVVLCPGGELRGGVTTPSLQTPPSGIASTSEKRPAAPADDTRPAGLAAEEPHGVLHRRRRLQRQPAMAAGAP